jgi:hypothetical protein
MTNEQLRKVVDDLGFEKAAKYIDWSEIDDPQVKHYWGFMQDSMRVIEELLFGEEDTKEYNAPPGGSGGS